MKIRTGIGFDVHQLADGIPFFVSSLVQDENALAYDYFTHAHRALLRIEAIITSMTPEERAKPSIINPSRKRRIAKGSGCNIATVNRFIKQFTQMQKMMKQMGGMGGRRRGRNPLSGMFGGMGGSRRGGFPF